MPIPRPAPEQRVWWIVGTIAITLSVIAAVWFGISATRGLYWQDTGHHVVDDRTIQLRFDVTDTERLPVQCTLKAFAEDHSVVGRRTVTLPASTFDSTRHVEDIRTTQRAVAATVETCVRPTTTP